VATGRVREGHGDLHAASIRVEGTSLHLFDCIAFNVQFAGRRGHRWPAVLDDDVGCSPRQC
jgi:hypothetical protein